MRRRIFILFASLTALLGFTPKKEETWHERMARHRHARIRDDLCRFYRVIIPDYADVDDRYQALLNLHEAGKISDDTLAKLGGECHRKLYNMEEHDRSRTKYSCATWHRQLSADETKQFHEELARLANNPGYIPILPTGARLR